MIERCLNHIELSVFLEHIVRQDSNLEFLELKDMILSVFTEASSEFEVLLNARKSAETHLNQIFYNKLDQNSCGISFY